jgi:hypothetical protein
MSPRRLTSKKAQLLLVENFLANRHKPKSLAPELLKKVNEETTTTPARDFMISKGIFWSKKSAFIHANAIGVLLSQIQVRALRQPLTEADCKYHVSPALREELEFEWGVYLAEIEGEASYYI